MGCHIYGLKGQYTLTKIKLEIKGAIGIMLYLEITENPTNKQYKNLIEYACSLNNVLMFKVFIDNTMKKDKEKKFKKTCEILNKTKEEMISLHNNAEAFESTINKIYGEFKDIEEKRIKRIYKVIMQTEENLESGEKIYESIKESIIRKNIEYEIESEIESIIFERNLKIMKEQLQQDFLKIKYQKKRWKNGIITDRYYYKISNRVKETLLQYDNLYSLKFPNCFEDISFYKDENCWLKTITHEKMCEIYPNSEKEIEQLKRIGLNFKIVEK